MCYFDPVANLSQSENTKQNFEKMSDSESSSTSCQYSDIENNERLKNESANTISNEHELPKNGINNGKYLYQKG